MMQMDYFIPLDSTHGVVSDMSDDEFPTTLSAWRDGSLQLDNIGTHFGYVQTGHLTIEAPAGAFKLKSGMYFSHPGACVLSGDGHGIVITRLDYHGMFLAGGPIEETGRLRYIDGCTDSLIIPPVVMGDPCLNALYFPPHTQQTEHTHPSMRAGIVTSGSGECLTPGGTIALTSDQIFVIPASSPHSFNTTHEPMVVIAYHPDSDFGPTHESHPMINRTIVEGVSASQLKGIRTA